MNSPGAVTVKSRKATASKPHTGVDVTQDTSKVIPVAVRPTEPPMDVGSAVQTKVGGTVAAKPRAVLIKVKRKKRIGCPSIQGVSIISSADCKYCSFCKLEAGR